ncbi:MAG: sigma-54-dependent Fis family transcriptional regulator [Gammaproteobacteria bacterium]|nr:sigma-54-dependent Fis family transcriptional regulator [Gammaproteobacteria bacterium]
MSVFGERLSNYPEPQAEGQVMGAWERFLSGQDYTSSVVRRLIRDSWSRCFDAGVDPSCQNGLPLLQSDGLTCVLTQHHDLVQACLPVMSEARDFLSESGTVMLLTDPAGLVIEMAGDPRAVEEAKGVRLEPGARWHENDCGTNAIGTALLARAPVQVHAAEHFCQGIKRWTCSATVIRDAYDGDVLGALDISGLSSTYNQHALALVVAAATRIEERLTQQSLALRHALLDHYQARLPRHGHGQYLLFDRAGRMVRASSGAAAALGALNVSFNTSRNTRLAALGVQMGDTGSALSVPAWLKADALEVIANRGQALGTVIHLPDAQPHRRALSVPTKALTVEFDAFADMLGSAPAVAEAQRRARQLARARVPVLILGETGAGKELFARAIHHAGPTSDGPLVTVNCGGLSRDLLASELFGYVDGAFTGARRGGMMGKVEAAAGGTLFLDEVGELPLDLQPHLLRVLEGGEVYRLGDTQPRKVRFRLLAATHRDLRAEVDAGRFRMDLFYRISVTSLELPPLRERKEDIAALAEHFMARLAEEHGLPAMRLAPSARDALIEHHWPGNVRELRNVIESALLTAEGASLDLGDLPAHILTRAPVSPAASGHALETAEKAAIEQALSRCAGNATQCARELGISKSTLYAKLRKYGLTIARAVH